MDIRKTATVTVVPETKTKSKNGSIVKGVVYLAIAVVFATSKFYNIVFEPSDVRDFISEFWAQFYDIYAPSWQNWVLSILFLILGGTEFIGVRKNGN